MATSGRPLLPSTRLPLRGCVFIEHTAHHRPVSRRARVLSPADLRSTMALLVIGDQDAILNTQTGLVIARPTHFSPVICARLATRPSPFRASAIATMPGGFLEGGRRFTPSLSKWEPNVPVKLMQRSFHG